MAPLASRLPEADAQALWPFVGQSRWAVDEGQRRLARTGVDRLSALDVWRIDAPALPKAGRHLVGVVRPSCGPLGQGTSRQVAVSLHGRGAEASGPLNWRLSMPQGGHDDQQRAAHGRVLPGTPSRSRTELAVDLIAQELAWEVPARPRVADTWYGRDCRCRQALRQRQLPSVVEGEASTGGTTAAPHVPWAPPRGPVVCSRIHP
jgi:SRSO17 transposase